MKKVLNKFLETSPIRIDEIKRGIQENQPETVFRAVHSLKTASAMVGAMSLSELNKELEIVSYQGTLPDNVLEQLMHIESEYQRVVIALKLYLQSESIEN